ncbi:paladin-like protein [Phytophthora cinnamomi]|uniref:paladin-like protein n=1 Tax=Phytophthora cinnamomi TaxID=4785 RepID=UPI0035593E0B|nr:paladin-like protein [Phytophthora cinnamomi]
MQAKQYEERILKLQDALEMQKLKNTSQLGRIRTLEDQLDKAQIALEEERDEKETILKNRQTNRLLMELREERVQRLQDLEEIYAKDKRLEAMAAEMSAATQGIHQVNEEIAHKDAELVGLRATARCSAKLLQKAEQDFLITHQDLENSQLKLLDCKRKLSIKEREVRVWIERYEQVMMDLHASQFRLTQLARDASSKEAALTRGHAIDIEHPANGVASLRARPVALMKPVGLHDRAVRKYRRDQIPNRALAGTASIASLQPASHLKAVRSAGSLPHVHTPGMPLPESKIGISRDCFQCTAATPLITKKNRPDITRDERDTPENQPGSKYLGYGLGLLKRDLIVPANNL